MPSITTGRRAAAVVAGLVAFAAAATSAASSSAAASPSAASSSAADSIAGEGDQLYISNGGTDTKAANIARFTIGADGLVTLATTVSPSLPPAGLVFTPDRGLRGRKFAYAATDNAIDRFAVGPEGALTLLGSTETPEPFGIAISPDGSTVFVANFDDPPFTTEHTVSAFHVGVNGDLILINTLDSGATHPKGVAVTPDGRFLYVVHGTPHAPEPSVITGFAVGADGSLSGPVVKAAIGPSGHRVVITPNGRFLYATMQEDGSAGDVFGFAIGVSGELIPVSARPFEAGVWVEGAAVSPDGRRLYVDALGAVRGDPSSTVADGQVRGFDIGADGVLTEVARIGYGLDPNDLAIGLDGRHVYAADNTGNTVGVFSVSSTGALALLQSTASGGAQPSYQGVTVQPRRF